MFIKLYTKEELNCFPIYVHTAETGHIQEQCTRPEGYNAHHLFVIEQGEGVVKLDNTLHTLVKGDMLYIGAYVPHEYYGATDDFTTSYFTFSGYAFENIKRYYGLSDFGVYKNKNNGGFERQLKTITSPDSPREASTLSALAYLAVISFFEDVCKKEYSPIEEVYNHIENHFSKSLTLDDFMEFYPYSKSKLCHDFKDTYNMTVFEMITKTRLRHAHYMLKSNPHLRIIEIASQCGFSDSSYFCKMYKKHYGNSPKGI